MKKKSKPAYYTSAIFVRGILIPGIYLAVAASVLFGLYMLLENEKAIREERFQTCLSNESEAKALTTLLTPNLPRIDYIEDLVTGDQITKLTALLTEQERGLPEQSLIREAIKPFEIGDVSPLGQGSTIGVQDILLNYTGKFPAMQQLAIQTEMIMPNLFMKTLDIVPSEDGDEKMLTFSARYFIFSQGIPQQPPTQPITQGGQL